jgi:hypothetical protein
MMHKMDVAIWESRVESVGAVEGEVVSAIACPVVVRYKEAFVDTTKYLGTDDLSV